MADNIRTYTAPDRTLRPDEKGFAAFETAGRRIPAAYNEAAQERRDIGQLQAHEIRGRAWPFDILALRDKTRLSLHIRGDTGGRRQRSASDYADEASQDMNRLAMGAGALGNYLDKTANQGGELVDVASGTTQLGRWGPGPSATPNLLSPTGVGGRANAYDPGRFGDPLAGEISQQITGGIASARGGDIGFQQLAPPPGYIGAPGYISAPGEITSIGQLSQPGDTAVTRTTAEPYGTPTAPYDIGNAGKGYVTQYAPGIDPGNDYGGGGDSGGGILNSVGGFFSGLWDSLTGAGQAGYDYSGNSPSSDY